VIPFQNERQIIGGDAQNTTKKQHDVVTAYQKNLKPKYKNNAN